MQRLILRSFQSPGDILMLTAAVRDLHAAHPGQFQTDVRTSADAIWKNNPYVTPLQENAAGVEDMMMHYPLIHQSNQAPYHFIHGYIQYLEEQLRLRIPVTRFHGDIHLTREEKEAPCPGADLGVPERFWIIMAGGKFDFTAKWWSPASYQKVVDHFRGRITFVQCGEQGHWHQRLSGVIDLVGKTNLRDYIRLMYHADGVVCPVTFAMHLGAAVETKPGRPRRRPCVVIAGGREPPHWEAYPLHQFISTVGALPCCAEGGCWKSRCQTVGDGDPKDHRELCERPVQVAPDLRIPKCMDMIAPDDVIRRIELYFEGGTLAHTVNGRVAATEAVVPVVVPVVAGAEVLRSPGKAGEAGDAHVASVETFRSPRDDVRGFGVPQPRPRIVERTTSILIKFRHGLGDAAQLTTVLQHLAHYHPDWSVDVASLTGKHSTFHGLCRRSIILDKEELPKAGYDRVFDLDWPECSTCYPDSPSTKAERCLREVFSLTPLAHLCTYKMNISARAQSLAREYFEGICKTAAAPDGRFPVVLIHYQGNTSTEYKNLPVEMVRLLCELILETGFVPVILDWDYRTPLADGKRVHNPHSQMPLWGDTGTGDADVLAALIEQAALMIGVDSGPLHVAGALKTPTIGVWTGHHPLHYFGLADNVTHLIPAKHLDFLRGDRRVGEPFFTSHYRYQVYQHLGDALTGLVKLRLAPTEDNLISLHDFWVRGDNAEQDLVIVRDVAEEDCYGVKQLPLGRPVVIDVGAHIGCFTRQIHAKLPSARIFAVECCPENLAALRKNVGAIATIVPAAVTYEKDVALCNAVFVNSTNTGATALINRQELEKKVAAGELTTERDSKTDKAYWADFRPLRTLTVEDLLGEHGLDRIDILKLDCEESEFSILRHTTSLDRIRIIVGEYHGRDKFLKLVADRFQAWKLRILRDGEMGVFWLLKP